MAKRVSVRPPASQLHLGPHHVGVVAADELHAQPVTVLAADAAQDRHRLVHVADDQVRAAVVVQVAEGHAVRQVVRVVIAADLPAYVLEPAAEVAVQHGRLFAAAPVSEW